MEELRRVVTIEELESDYHFDRLLNDKDYIAYNGLMDR